jgi:hypothetical protein
MTIYTRDQHNYSFPPSSLTFHFHDPPSIGRSLLRAEEENGFRHFCGNDFLDRAGVIVEVHVEQLLKTECDVFYVHVAMIEIFYQWIHELSEPRDRTGSF